MVTGHDLIKALLAAVAGGVVGWSANALTVVGRVDAMERLQTRMEAHQEQQRQQMGTLGSEISRLSTRLGLLLNRVDPKLDYSER